ncbi:MAG: hypothetical protein U0414_04615 [Polyangiaceae bacterium]
MFVALWIAPATALADVPKPTENAGDHATKEKLVVGEAGKRKDGWTPGIAVGGTFDLLDSRNVVGQQDGTALSLGAAVDAELDFNKKIHEWRSTLTIDIGASLTPGLGEFVKTTDSTTFETIYLAHIIEELGPFGRFALNTSLFPTLDISADASDYRVTNADGTTKDYHGRRLALTDPFTPTTFKESVGAFTQPVKNDRITFEGRLGLGAQETLADGQLAISDDSATDVVEVSTLRDSYEIGGEAVANAWGAIDKDKRVTYSIGVGVLVPFAYSDLPAGDDRGVGDLVNVEVNGALNVHIFDWASLDYKISVLRQPLLVDALQVSNTLLLTIGGEWGSKAPEEPEEPACDCDKEEKAPAEKPAADKAKADDKEDAKEDEKDDGEEDPAPADTKKTDAPEAK